MIFRWLFIAILIVWLTVLYSSTSSINQPSQIIQPPPVETKQGVKITIEKIDNTEKIREAGDLKLEPEDNTKKEIEKAVTSESNSIKTLPEKTIKQEVTKEKKSTNSTATAFKETGKASHYGWAWDGKTTASGATLDGHALQAAHKTLEFGTMVKVSLKDDPTKSVIVKIIDRGPYVDGRIIDLTPAAFEELAPASRGIIDVVLEIAN